MKEFDVQVGFRGIFDIGPIEAADEESAKKQAHARLERAVKAFQRALGGGEADISFADGTTQEVITVKRRGYWNDYGSV